MATVSASELKSMENDCDELIARCGVKGAAGDSEVEVLKVGGIADALAFFKMILKFYNDNPQIIEWVRAGIEFIKKLVPANGEPATNPVV